MAAAAGGGADSGVETECEVESNDSSMSNLSVSDNSNMAAPSLPPLPPLPALSPPITSHQQQEDGYLGDCSSDGGNEKNFPLPPDWRRISLPPSPIQSDTPSSPNNTAADDIEPPAGLQFAHCSTVTSDTNGAGPSSGLGYHILPLSDWTPAAQSTFRSKIRHGRSVTGLRSKYNAQSVADDWSKVKRTIAERKLRTAANTNNSDQVEQLCAAAAVDVNSCDEHKRSALHFAAAKVGKDIRKERHTIQCSCSGLF